MRYATLTLAVSLGLSSVMLSAQITGYPDPLYSRPERTRYAETSLHSDVVSFVESLRQNSGLVHIESIGISNGGRSIPLVIMADPVVTNPDEARSSGKLVIYIQGNIHGGEVEGKEASMQLMREIAFGKMKYLLDNQVLIFCPLFNADGNDALGPNNRPNQDGSPYLAGQRTSGQGYDLNRDGMKLETIEGKAFMERVMLRWDPLVVVDLHTTNGTWHGYAITTAPGMATAGHPGTTQYIQNELFPWVNEKVKERAGYDIFYYGDFYEYPPRTFYGMAAEPRYLTNSVALRNRLSILVETFSHDRFEKRISSNIVYLTSLLEYTGANSQEIQNLTKTIDKEVVQEIRNSGGTLQKGVAFEYTQPGQKTDLLVYEVKSGKRTGKRVWFSDVKLMNQFSPVRHSIVPKEYVFPSELTQVAAKLREHGIEVTQTAQNATYSGENFTITRWNRDATSYQGHRMASVDGSFTVGTAAIPAGSWYVDMAQPLAYLIFYLLEPNSDDGLVVWNYFDDYLIEHNVNTTPVSYPVFKVLSGGSGNPAVGTDQNKINALYNPASGKISLFGLSAEHPSQIEVTSVSGSVIKRLNIPAGAKNCEIELPHVATGIFMVAITLLGKTTVKKVIIRNLE